MRTPGKRVLEREPEFKSRPPRNKTSSNPMSLTQTDYIIYLKRLLLVKGVEVKKVAFFIIILIFGLLLFGCDNKQQSQGAQQSPQYLNYINPKENLTISYPVGWAYNESPDQYGLSVCFNPPSVRGCVMQAYIVNFSTIDQSHWLYGVVSESSSIEEIKDAYINTLKPKNSSMDMNVTKVEKTTLLGNEAYHIEFVASIKTSFETLESKEIHIISKNNTSIIILKYSYPPKDFDSFKPQFDIFVSSFIHP